MMAAHSKQGSVPLPAQGTNVFVRLSVGRASGRFHPPERLALECKKKWEPIPKRVWVSAPTAPDLGCCPLAISASAVPASGFRANIVMVFGFPHHRLRNVVSV